MVCLNGLAVCSGGRALDAGGESMEMRIGAKTFEMVAT